MRVESRTDKELTDKAQAQAAQSWAANVKQVRVTAGRGGGWLQVGVQCGKHTLASWAMVVLTYHSFIAYVEHFSQKLPSITMC